MAAETLVNAYNSVMKWEIAMASITFLGVPFLIYKGYEYRTVSQNRVQHYCSKQIIAVRDQPTAENLKALEHCRSLPLNELRAMKPYESPYIQKSPIALQGKLAN